MSVLVTGGAGYIGSHMILELLEAGEEVVVLDNLSTGFREAVAAEATFVIGDVGDGELVERVLRDHGVDAVIHFAGSIIVPESVEKPLKYYANNTANSRTLIEACVNQQVRNFIFSSTAAVYGMPENNPVFENEPLNPMSPYGSSKLMTEIMLGDTAAAHSFNFAALRYFNVAGADPQGRVGQSTPNATHLIKVACQAALGQRPFMQVFGTDYDTPDGTCIRDYIHVVDLARAHLLALGYLRGGNGNLIMNCGYGAGFSVLEVIESVKRAAGHDFDVRMADRRAGDPAAIVAGARQVRELGWQPHHDDLDRIVAHAYAWEKKLGETGAPS
jgi:UDP-glucose 4-epimerase